ncbi:Ubiquitin recognition factor in ER-associated degradation protein 1 [Linum perenne]
MSGISSHYHLSDDIYQPPRRRSPSPPPFTAVYSCQQSPTIKGNQIIMPQSALDLLATDFESLNLRQPMVFEITTIEYNDEKPRVSHCGVSEFTAEEGVVLIPPSLANTLHLEDGTTSYVQVKRAVLEKATYVKLQPHSTEFFASFGPDIKKGLEESLIHSFFCVTTGDTIEIRPPGVEKRFLVDVVETKPDKAVSLVDTDCEVDFDTPLDYDHYKVAQQKRGGSSRGLKFESSGDKETKNGGEECGFVAFSGSSRRLVDDSVEKSTSNKGNQNLMDGDKGKGGVGSCCEKKDWKPFTKYTLISE